MNGKRASVRMVTIPKSDLESLEATIETLENRYVMKQLEATERDIKAGRVRKARDFLKELSTA
jgi:hypothetical protein